MERELTPEERTRLRERLKSCPSFVSGLAPLSPLGHVVDLWDRFLEDHLHESRRTLAAEEKQSGACLAEHRAAVGQLQEACERLKQLPHAQAVAAAALFLPGVEEWLRHQYLSPAYGATSTEEALLLLEAESSALLREALALTPEAFDRRCRR